MVLASSVAPKRPVSSWTSQAKVTVLPLTASGLRRRAASSRAAQPARSSTARVAIRPGAKSGTGFFAVPGPPPAARLAPRAAPRCYPVDDPAELVRVGHEEDARFPRADGEPNVVH